MLFGHQNDVNQGQPDAPAPVVSDHTVSQQDPGVNPLAVDPATGASLPVVPPNSPGPVDTPNDAESSEPSVLNQPIASGLDGTQDAVEDPSLVPDPGTPFATSPASQAPTLDAPANEVHEAATIAAELDSPSLDQAPSFAQAASSEAAATPQPTPGALSPVNADTAAVPLAPAGTDDLLSLKQQAISQLSPLIGHLDQSAEEKFRTTMMLIQTTDNPGLLKDAYEAAQAISDDKVRAQALLDVVNEINYFTQQQDAQGS